MYIVFPTFDGFFRLLATTTVNEIGKCVFVCECLYLYFIGVWYSCEFHSIEEKNMSLCWWVSFYSIQKVDLMQKCMINIHSDRNSTEK